MKNPYLYLTAKRVLQQIDSDERTWTEALLFFRRLLPLFICWTVSLPLVREFAPWIEEHPAQGRVAVLLCAIVADFVSKLSLQSREDGNDVLLKYLPGSGKLLALRFALSFFRLVNLDVLAIASWGMLMTSAFPHVMLNVILCIAAGWFNTLIASATLRLYHQHNRLWINTVCCLWTTPLCCSWSSVWFVLLILTIGLVGAYFAYKQAFRYPDYHEASAGQGVQLKLFGAGVPKLVMRQLLSPSLKWATLLMVFWPLAIYANSMAALPSIFVCMWGAMVPIYLGELGFTPESASADGMMVWQRQLLLKILRTRMGVALALGTLFAIATCWMSPAESRISMLVGSLYFMAIALHASFPVAAFLKQRWDLSSKQRRVVYCYYNLAEMGLLVLGGGLYWLLGELEAHWAVMAAITLLLLLLLPISSKGVYNRFYENRYSFLTAFRKD
ncbi:MAG: hypothetical protein J6Z12_04435 [Paludibacteraceae bacterium]|nr:hypothetical protein [Paludibacteraceae bacterium]